MVSTVAPGISLIPEAHTYDAGTGLTPQTIDYIVDVKGEPEWIREFRHKALAGVQQEGHADPLGDEADLENIVFDNIRYYLSRGTKPSRSPGTTCPMT